MALNQQVSFISEQDYMAGELISKVKHEYINGDVYAMAGASKNHDKIAGNIFAKFHLYLEDTTCTPFSSDVKVKVENDYFYPDAH